jgi:L-iditol 2-dehydrogenase
MEGMGVHGGFAEYIWLPFVSQDAVMKLPDSLSFQDLAMIEPLGLSVGLAKKANPGDVVVVLGQELVGLGTVAALKKKGVARVISSDFSEKRLMASKEMGADVAVNTLKDDLIDIVMQETRGRGADIAILTDHRPVALTQATNTVKRTDIIWLAHTYGSPFKLGSSIGTGPRFAVGADFHGFIEQPISYDSALLYMRSAWGTMGERIPRFKEAVELMESGIITAEKVVTHVYPLERIRDAFEMAANFHKSIEVMVEPWMIRFSSLKRFDQIPL